MCGPYPGVDGINFRERSDAVNNLKMILADGINGFLSLQSTEELALLRSGEAHPYFTKYEDYKEILQEHFNMTPAAPLLNPQFSFNLSNTPAVTPANMYGRLCGPQWDARMGVSAAAAVQYDSIPIEDGNVPPDRKAFAVKIQEICDALRYKRLKVYLHCVGGHGRSGLVAACIYMAYTNIYNADYAMACVQKAHDMRRIPDERCSGYAFVMSPNTMPQREFVREFASYLSFVNGKEP